MSLAPAPLPADRRACLALALAAAAAGCGGVDPALLVQVAVDPAVRASCIEVSVFTSQDASGTPAGVVRVVRSPGKDSVDVAVFKGALPARVWVSARPEWGGDGCQLPLSPNGDPETVEGTFPPSGIDPLPISIDPLPRGQDADRDGFQGGGPGAADCDDGDGGVNPGASERCLQPVDANCDGRIGCADPTCPASACLASPVGLAFITGSRMFNAGACSSAVTVQTQDAAGAAQAVVAPTTVTFGSPGGRLATFSDTQCQSARPSAVIAAGGNATTVYLSGTVAGPATLTAAAQGLPTAQQQHTIRPASINRLAFTTPQQTVALNGCSQPMTVQLQDAYGNPTPVGAARTVTLSATGGGAAFRFYPDAACANSPITQTQIAAAASSATFHVRSTATTPATVTVTATEGSRSANQVVNLEARTPAHLAFLTGPLTVPLNACSPAVAVQTQDGTGQPAPVQSPLTVSLGESPGGAVAFFSDPGCNTSISQVTIDAGLNQASFHFQGAQQGPATLTATSALTSPALGVTIGPPLPTSLRFTSAPQPPLAAGACSGDVVLTTFDGANNASPVAASTDVTLGSSLADVTFFAGSGCSGAPVPSVTIAAGASAVTYSFIGTRSGTGALSATANGLTSPTPQAITVNAAALAGLRFVQGPVTVNAGSCSGSANALRIQSVDAYGNLVNVQTNTDVTVSAQNPATPHTISFHDHFNCTGGGPTNTFRINAGSNQTSSEIFFKTNGAGTWAFRGDFAGLTSAMEDQTVKPLAPDKVAFTSPPQTLNHGQCSNLVTIQAQDQHGNRSPLTAAVDVDLGPGSMSFFTNQSCNGTTITRVTIAATTTNQQYYFRAPNSGASVTITLGPVGSSGLAGASQVVTLQ